MQVVPQYIDVEDKIAGPLTWKHLGWFFLGGGLLLLAFVLFDRVVFYIIAVFILAVVGFMAFAKPIGVSAVEFVGFGITYLFQPKVYTWERDVQKISLKNNKNNKKNIRKEKKEVDMQDIQSLAMVLDSQGRERNERIQQIIKERTNKK